MTNAIWIADDDADDRMIIKEEEENGYAANIRFFEDGEKVFLKINEDKENGLTKFPSLLILDLNMPKINGLELLILIKKNSKTKDIPVVILTTSRNHHDKEKVIKLGAADFITKPFSFNEMIKITKDLIEKYG